MTTTTTMPPIDNMMTENPNNCNNNICENGGACLLFVVSNAFRCVCTVGFTGELCETGLSVIKNKTN
jgi:hypothetical protein